MKLGDLQQTGNAFNQVVDALSFIITAYGAIATWFSVVQRLSTSDMHVAELTQRPEAAGGVTIGSEGGGLSVSDLALQLPDGRPLIAGVALDAHPGDAVLVSGPTGIGKSTVLRAIAGLWPFGHGQVRVDRDRILFVPQRPYTPLGSLRQALAYPEDGTAIPDERLKAVLHQVGLGSLEGDLDTTDNWSQRLSGGEQQRLAFARVFLSEPAVIVLDEATSALDEETEAHLYRMLREASWRPAIVSVGHRGTLRRFHDRVLDLAPHAPRHAAMAARL
jgi:putative ATP-binding cassette transporter